jgi:hypothetical protein
MRTPRVRAGATDRSEGAETSEDPEGSGGVVPTPPVGGSPDCSVSERIPLHSRESRAIQGFGRPWHWGHESGVPIGQGSLPIFFGKTPLRGFPQEPQG